MDSAPMQETIGDLLELQLENIDVHPYHHHTQPYVPFLHLVLSVLLWNMLCHSMLQALCSHMPGLLFAMCLPSILCAAAAQRASID